MNGVYMGDCLPARILATREANRPSVCPDASTTNHLRAISCPPGKRVTISKLLRIKATKKDRSMTPLTTFLNGRHKAGQLQSSEIKEYSTRRNYVNVPGRPLLHSAPTALMAFRSSHLRPQLGRGAQAPSPATADALTTTPPCRCPRGSQVIPEWRGFSNLLIVMNTRQSGHPITRSPISRWGSPPYPSHIIPGIPDWRRFEKGSVWAES